VNHNSIPTNSPFAREYAPLTVDHEQVPEIIKLL
jgi:hypothetical protein